MSGTCCGTASRSFEEIRSTSQGHGINKDVTVWNGFFYVKGRIGMPPGARLCPADLHISTESPNMLCSVNKGFAGVCVYLCGFFSLLCTLPTGLCLRTVPTGLVPLIVGQAPICGQVTLFLNLAGQKNLFLHSQDCCEGLDWDWLWVSSYLESPFSKSDIYILDINILVGDWIFTFQSGSL